MDFNTSTPLTIRYSGKIGIEVNLERQYANGIVIHQIKQLSNKNVMIGTDCKICRVQKSIDRHIQRKDSDKSGCQMPYLLRRLIDSWEKRRGSCQSKSNYETQCRRTENNPVSRRSWNVLLTDYGSQKADEVIRIFNRIDNVIYNGFSEEEVQTLSVMAGKVEKNLWEAIKNEEQK